MKPLHFDASQHFRQCLSMIRCAFVKFDKEIEYAGDDSSTGSRPIPICYRQPFLDFFICRLRFINHRRGRAAVPA